MFHSINVSIGSRRTHARDRRTEIYGCAPKRVNEWISTLKDDLDQNEAQDE
jgi:hypothetical protein